MDVFRRLSVILQKPDVISPDGDSTFSQEAHKKLKISQEFDSLGFTWLHTFAPCFPVDGNKVTVIHEPNIFYKTVVERCRTAKRRITLASLYLGTGHLEEQLVAAISENLRASGDQLKVKVLLDHTRGSRGEPNSRRMLLPLLNKYKDLCQVSLYHTPVLRGLLHRLMPERYNEVLGLQHMKVYLFDDSLLISGANLSNDYFTNRQDRYVLIEDCGPLADFYDGLVSRVSEFSLQLDQGDQVHLHSSWKYHPYKGKKGEFKSAAKDRVWSYISSTMTQQQNHGISGTGDTWIFPLVEMGQLGLHQDSCVTKKMFETALPGSIIHLATGYFNLTQEYTISIINHSAASFNILMAHPTANGFLGAQGPAGGIPAAYTLLASAFFKQQQISGQEQRIQMAEFQKKGWTYHAKGLWYTLPGQNLPILTLVGSPNFGNRSVCRDLETQIAIVTKNPKLQQNLLEERERLYASSTPFTSETLSQPDRKYAPLWVHMAVRLFRNLL
ncbi:CDP-diacylglycerol--glycerol-3-phosphate 3-phosphatidyltransferase, mitochondrial isoform X2 [Periplaneta americana]